jgi:hypothetical protein
MTAASGTGALPPEVPLFDADGALSREYLLHRGTCCGNGCRNCPYGGPRPAPWTRDTMAEWLARHGDMDAALPLMEAHRGD